jgi:hypothetical protein
MTERDAVEFEAERGVTLRGWWWLPAGPGRGRPEPASRPFNQASIAAGTGR